MFKKLMKQKFKRMGCVSSKPHDINDTHSNIFVVQSLNDEGEGSEPSHMEVTEQTIMFHQAGHNTVSWPLKSLRRYGADNEIFSFEAGRKCQTGAGIYAFRCKRAQKLLNVVQVLIINLIN